MNHRNTEMLVVIQFEKKNVTMPSAFRSAKDRDIQKFCYMF